MAPSPVPVAFTRLSVACLGGSAIKHTGMCVCKTQKCNAVRRSQTIAIDFYFEKLFQNLPRRQAEQKDIKH